MKRAKMTAIITLLVLCAVFILQNTSTVEITFIFWTVSMPRAVWIVVVLLVGIVIGALLNHNKRYIFR
ncbi:DUF1049 domain-containing protein [Aestuariibacter sp. GS-14]|uniref:lipopolysaccharide assembly protein LapA domain-containing protein n=1 Tax=Alteromonadaceae TaxID=72275 RepID=UPI0011299A0D|nr:lipopolysaccharide assembly protein LapA domain-containing protein [Aestuariibacter sp. GS-14]TPV57297.1 DUF1049 domain-containing protein [Aestuariibacter sp. GS-14]